MSAVLSECRKFRYLLHRKTNCPLRWIKPMVFVMINPSTADEQKDDKTILKCIAIAEHNSCTDLYVVNLFPLRTKDVKEVDHYMKNTAASEVRPFSEENDRHITEVMNMLNAEIIVAWGAYKKIDTTKILAINFFKKHKGYDFKCVGINKDGSPKHPLFLSAKTPLIDYKAQVG